MLAFLYYFQFLNFLFKTQRLNLSMITILNWN